MMRAAICPENGERQEDLIILKEENVGNATAVFIDALTNFPIDPENGAEIEIPIENVESWTADYLYGEFWCRPSFGKSLSDVPDDTQGFIYKKYNGDFGVILPVVSENYKCVLKGKSDGALVARLFSRYEGMTECRALTFVRAEGEDPFKLLKECAETGLKLLGRGVPTREKRRYPEIFEYLGFNSWDAFHIGVNEDCLIKKCREFKEKNIPVKWIILDDMWGDVRDFYDRTYKDEREMTRLMHSSRLYSFKACVKRFPNGLKGAIEKINEYGIAVGVWHPTTGYWMGIDPNGDIFRDYGDCLIKATDGKIVPDPDKEKSYKFYSAYHDYLKSAGAEFVKVDNQSMSRRFYKNIAPVGKVARDYHDALEASVGQHFDNAVINCMGMASEDMWNRSASPVSRCSDDFQPEDAEWFTKHILQCSYNSLIQGQFYYCDWDMWWTDDGQAEKNSVLRAVSGGPVYVSDELGRSRLEVLKPLTLNDGKILRCDRPAVPTKDCLTEDPVASGKIFKLKNMSNGCGIIAAFNLNKENKPVSGTVSPNDLEDLEGGEFGFYEYFSKELIIIKNGESVNITLKSINDYRLYIAVPLKNGCGVIGRTDKFISPATYKRLKNGGFELIEEGPCAEIKDYKLKTSP